MESTHEDGFSRLTDRLDVVATVDPDLDRARHAAEILGAPRAVADYRDVIDEVDAALLVLPHHLHYPVGMDFIAAGKHILMEKPLANSERECLDLIQAAEQAGVLLMVAYPMRFHPLVLALKNEIDAGRIGEVFQISIWTEQLTRRAADNWLNSAELLGGGQLFSHGCHYIDLLLWMLGKPIVGTHMGTRKGTEWMEGEGTSNVAIEFASGALGYHFGTWGAQGTKHGYEFQAFGSDGMLAMDLSSSTLTLHRGSTVETLHRHRGSTKHVEGELTHFLDCLDGKAEPFTDGPGSLQGLRVIWRLYEAERRRVVADLTGLGLDEPWDLPGLDLLPSSATAN